MTSARHYLNRSPAFLRRAARHFLTVSPPCVPLNYPLSHFFSDLHVSGCSYVVLRWFDQLPYVDPGEDLDLLVADRHVETLRRHLSQRIVLRTRIPYLQRLSHHGTKCDVYSVSGLLGSDYKGVAYYPPHLAQQILDRSVQHTSGAYTPCAEDHYFSLAYHALYHKGLRSGLPVRDPRFSRYENPEHDYTGVLRALALKLGFDVEIEMDALDAMLTRYNWSPPADLLERVAPHDEWCRARVEAILSSLPRLDGLAVFVVRERASDPDSRAQIIRFLDDDGFRILATKDLRGVDRTNAARELRGGNWGRGPWSVSGGLPAMVIAALDPRPDPPSPALLRQHPFADNARVFSCKEKIRYWFNARLPLEQQCNIVHSSDRAQQASLYIRTLMVESESAIYAAAADRAVVNQLACV